MKKKSQLYRDKQLSSFSQRGHSLSANIGHNTLKVFEGIVALLDQLSSKHHKLISKLVVPKHDGDLSPTQVILLFNLHDRVISVSELYSQNIYMGTNVSYSLKKLMKDGYILQQRSKKDKRILLISLSGKGQALRVQLQQFYRDVMTAMLNTCPIDANDLRATLENLGKIDQFWTQELHMIASMRI